MKEIVAGIDIGGTNTLLGMVDSTGIIHQRESIKTTKYDTFNQLIEDIAQCIIHSLKMLGKDYALTGIGIGAPNGNYHSGRIEFAVNLPWKDTLPVVFMMKQYFDVKVILTNDANAAAMGEMIFGCAQNMKDFIMITLGTGLGSGIVVDGKVVYGHDGNAGELGHTIVEPGGRLCGCGRKGCLETIVSATGITRTVKIILDSSDRKSMLRNYPADHLDSKKIFEAANAGDEVALEAFDFTCRVLGKSLADAVTYTSPEAFILFGGLANAKKFLLEPTKKYMENDLLKVYQNKVKILPSQLPENDAAILGAAALVRV